MTTRDLSLVALMAAVIVALGLVPAFPLAAGVPITLQSMGVMLAGLVLGPKRAAAAVLVVIALVALGLPVLAGGRGGLAVFSGKTTGFLVGWVLAALVTGFLAQKVDRNAYSVVQRAIFHSFSAITSGVFCATLVFLVSRALNLEIPLAVVLAIFAVVSVVTWFVIAGLFRRYGDGATRIAALTGATVIGCIVLLHACGVSWIVVAFKLDWTGAFLLTSLPFVPGDLAKAIVAAVVTVKVRQAVAIERK